jgi:hypothetical protein
VLDYRWAPGENRATCLSARRRPCPASPGQSCNCGFWAAWSPRLALSRTCATIEPPWQVMGLVSLSGAVVPHGADGVRAERAALRCLFSDRPWSWVPPVPAVPDSDWDALRFVAEDYGVPLLSLSHAASRGLTESPTDPNLLSTLAGRPAAGDPGRTAR